MSIDESYILYTIYSFCLYMRQNYSAGTDKSFCYHENKRTADHRYDSLPNLRMIVKLKTMKYTPLMLLNDPFTNISQNTSKLYTHSQQNTAENSLTRPFDRNRAVRSPSPTHSELRTRGGY